MSTIFIVPSMMVSHTLRVAHAKTWYSMNLNSPAALMLRLMALLLSRSVFVAKCHAPFNMDFHLTSVSASQLRACKPHLELQGWMKADESLYNWIYAHGELRSDLLEVQTSAVRSITVWFHGVYYAHCFREGFNSASPAYI